MFTTDTQVIYENALAGQAYSLPFDWLDNSQILVYGDSKVLTEVSEYTLDKTARTITPLSNYGKLVVTRYTLGSNLEYNFANIKSLKGKELEEALTIIRQLSEEGFTQTIHINEDGKYDFEGFRVTNIGDPLDPEDLLSLGYAENYKNLFQTLHSETQENANIATEKADIATAKADIAIERADLATTKASEAYNYTESARVSASTASNKAAQATEQAGIASQKASEAATSASEALESKNGAFQFYLTIKYLISEASNLGLPLNMGYIDDKYFNDFVDCGLADLSLEEDIIVYNSFRTRYNIFPIETVLSGGGALGDAFV